MLLCRALVVTCSLVCGTLYTPVSAAQGRPDRVTLNIAVTHRNGAAILAVVLERLQELQRDREYSAALARQDLSDVDALCISNARTDPSGRVFDLARCAKVWPAEDKAPQPKAFERAFGRGVAEDGIKVFPAVTVSTFDFTLRLKTTQLPGAVSLASLDSAGAPTDARVDELLCDPKVTYVSREECKVRVVPRRGIHVPDVYVTQTGYRLLLKSRLDDDKAVKLRAAILKGLPLPAGTPADAISILLSTSPPAHREQGADRSTAPPSMAGNQSVINLWKGLGLAPSDLQLSKPPGSRLPPILVFDASSLSAPKPISEWLKTVKMGGGCTPVNIEGDSHSDAVASLLFPAMLAARPEDVSSQTWVPNSWSGFFFSSTHFDNSIAFENGADWYEKTGYARPGDPAVAVAVFSRQFKNIDSGRAEHAARTFLADPSNVLVVSAPDRAKFDPGTPNFSGAVDEPRLDAERIEELCYQRPWPACLGRHPRVLVVGPASYSQGGAAAPHQTNNYLMGASTVRMLAPGAHVPVAVKCQRTEGSTAFTGWALSTSNGTSYAAPIVALVVSRMLQLGPDSLREIPEAALWRTIATSTDVAYGSGVTASQQAQFGALNAGKALVGVTPEELGPWNAATVYSSGDGGGASGRYQAVVMPYPWTDSLPNVQSQLGVRTTWRGYLTFAAAQDVGFSDAQTIAFERVLRIRRRTGEDANGVPLFDLYFIETTGGGDKPFARAVTVRRKVRFGVGDVVGQQGFCRSDGIAMPASQPGKVQGQAQPACLYVWKRGKDAFEPLDLRTVDDIVLPPTHNGAGPPAKIDPTDVRQVIGPGSPWAAEFCATGPRMAAEKVLVEQLKQPKFEQVCQRS